jgi:hypothetical protein
MSNKGAYIAFDLDNTLGYFDIIAPLAFFWSPEFLSNPDQAKYNAPLRISNGLKGKLKRARDRFASALLRRTDLLEKILRPNLNTLIDPIVSTRYLRKVKAVVIYSNTTNYYKMELAKALIEREFKAPGLFSLVADIYHPLRGADHVEERPERHYIEPLKTYASLHELLQEAADTSAAIHPHQVAFIDDRKVLHELIKETPAGLLYIQPTSFFAAFSKKERQQIMQMALEAMQQVGLLNDVEYMRSGICNRIVAYEQFPLKKLRGFPDVLSYVWSKMMEVPNPRAPWCNDGFSGGRCLASFLHEF